MTFPHTAFWSAFASAGLLVPASAKSHGVTYTANVGYSEPDVTTLINGVQTKQYVIEYQAADFPVLAEGDVMTVGGVRFKVRQPPYVSENPTEGDDGFFRRALLTRI